ncbi:hypothetical protein ACQPW3_19415 [Actinosynnema sp. CA-248983]
MDGLWTGAADLDGDGQITARDLYAYVYERLRRESPDQTPTTSGVVAVDLRIAHVGTPLPAGLPDELRRLVRSADPSLRAEEVRMLRTRAEAGDTVSAQALRLLAAGHDPELSAAASAALGLPVEQPVSTPGPAVLPHHAMLARRTTAVAFSPDSSRVAAPTAADGEARRPPPGRRRAADGAADRAQRDPGVGHGNPETGRHLLAP